MNEIPAWLARLVAKRREELTPEEFEQWLLGVNQGRRGQGILL
ncbi:MAG: hypothetical protein VW362_08080 [Candidatus Nanopelagicales bacterium]